ncbi:MAG: glycerophosphodiester phosphodiesterase family protein [Clostridia bacterium]|nr:glycerophosphodiester phosphodiesterase family protein [Clostridia bacterium]
MKKIKTGFLLLTCALLVILSACDVQTSPTAQPTTSDGFNKPAKELTELYSACTLVVDEEARIYTKNAAERLKELIAPKLDTQIKASHTPVEGELTVYVGAAGHTSDAWQGFNKNGYVIWQSGGTVVLSGSNAENTYTAVSRYIVEVIKNDAINIGRIDDGLLISCDYGNRADYIADIDKFQTVWQYDWHSPEWAHDFSSKIKDFLMSNSRPISYGHRGDVEHYPENSIEGIISAIKKGVDLVEVDVCRTSDNVLVLNHGDDLRATTDWSEKRGQTIDGVKLPTSFDIGKWTYEQLSKLCLRTGNGEYAAGKKSEITDYRIVTLEEVFSVCNEKCFVLIDKLTASDWDDVFSVIKKTGAARCFIYAGMAGSREEASKMKADVREALGTTGPSFFESGRSWSGTWYDEFELTTTEQFDKYYKQQVAIGSIVSTNRICRLIDYIDRYYYADKAPGNTSCNQK